MSLTRDEWCRMWESIKSIEADAQILNSKIIKGSILTEVLFIKKKIQQVIGQME